ncbi:MAG: hypothetical protein CMJ67_07790 [Planctomycetaceae bacterium]|nr:hypothetical protein [Planctomycetaceae bacterium]
MDPEDQDETLDVGSEARPSRPTGGRMSRASYVPGDSIGTYKIRQRLGEGGFGIVFLCEQFEPVRREVAVKVIKAGMDTEQVVGRFEAERQALAIMDHPCIAKIFDAGSTEDGRPYFVMELVRGVPLTEYCDKQKLNLKERLELFARICDGVQHAHQKGVIHRDLKPGNILVTDADRSQPQPKIIDFGIAKATAKSLSEKEVFTLEGQLIGTPEYMSPEQAEMTSADIDTRTDVYALGIVLYELLTGRLPFDPRSLRSKGLSEIQRIIREEDPPRPSTRLTTIQEGSETGQIASERKTTVDALSSTLRRELEWIPLKAIRKDRTDRYSSAEALASDVRRYLGGDPLEAGPESTSYRLRKFVRRHRVAFATSSLVAAAILLGLIGTTIFAIEADRQRGIAVEARTRAEERLTSLQSLVEAMSGSINNSVKNLDGGMEVRRRMLGAAEEQLTLLREEAEASDDPVLFHTVGQALISMGDLAGGLRVASLGDDREADSYYREALAIYEDLLEDRDSIDPRIRDEIMVMPGRIVGLQADLAISDRRWNEARKLVLDQKQRLEPLVNNGDVWTRREFLMTYEKLGDIELRQANPKAALVHYLAHRDEIQALVDADASSDPGLRRGLASTLRRVGYAQGETGDPVGAEVSLRRSLQLMSEVSSEQADDLRRSRDVGWAEIYLGQFLLGRDQEEQVVEGVRQLTDGALRIVRICAVEPGVSDYRDDARIGIVQVHEMLLDAGRSPSAFELREESIRILQPVVEGSPENVALADALAAIVALRAE